MLVTLNCRRLALFGSDLCSGDKFEGDCRLVECNCVLQEANLIVSRSDVVVWWNRAVFAELVGVCG